MALIEITDPDQLVETLYSLKTDHTMRWESTVFKYTRKTTMDILKMGWEVLLPEAKARFTSFDDFVKQNADNVKWALHSYAYRILHHKD